MVLCLLNHTCQEHQFGASPRPKSDTAPQCAKTLSLNTQGLTSCAQNVLQLVQDTAAMWKVISTYLYTNTACLDTWHCECHMTALAIFSSVLLQLTLRWVFIPFTQNLHWAVLEGPQKWPGFALDLQILNWFWPLCNQQRPSLPQEQARCNHQAEQRNHNSCSLHCKKCCPRKETVSHGMAHWLYTKDVGIHQCFWWVNTIK